MTDMPTLEHWLEAGLAAARAGDVAQARDRLEALRANPAADQHPTELGQWQNLMAKGHIEDDDGLDDPPQCPTCGQLTQEKDKHCPHCRQKLLFALERPDNSPYMQRLLLWQWAAVALAALACAGPATALANISPEAHLFSTYLNHQVPLNWFLGDIFTRPVDLSWLVLWVLAGLALTQLPASERDFISEVQRVYTQPDTVTLTPMTPHWLNCKRWCARRLRGMFKRVPSRQCAINRPHGDRHCPPEA